MPDAYAPTTNPVDGAQMIWIPAGPFVMGSSDEDIAVAMRQHPEWDPRWFAHEKPQRTVELPGYWIYAYPVTVAQFRAFCAATAHAMPDEPAWGWQEAHPIVNVSWDDAQAYAAWAGAALPTEAEWEKAARGTDGGLWPWGNARDVARGAATDATQPVGSFPEGASPYGVQDMAGNVWEWCQAAPAGEYDRPAPRVPSRRPTLPHTRVLRGGSFQCAYDAYLRCAVRNFDCDTQRGRGPYRRPTCGFRCIVRA